MTAPITARGRIKAWLKTNANDHIAGAYEGGPLLASDLQALMDAFDAPCGSCHPCANYADETWRAAGRTPPHASEWDGALHTLAMIRELAAGSESVTVEALRKALAGELS